ncbi:hypothetical protein SAMN04488128_10756 [Chitinophaga eiseniae]|uniref:Uncharacterized protein n=1 Tax=Chitinophaga eiseniae TaxID=634771 RepID=A0A1T4TZD9_9BACT|nr:hypothetical protein [Chitinophaga eiseniae]SKA45629.1 hypothetical protein SAMN04488128_10756 [Chitinophaga eiseniae]
MKMQPAQIILSYRQLIDATSTGDLEKKIFEDSYVEFLMQSQAYNTDKQFRTFTELKAHNPKSNSLHYKVGFAVGLHLQEMGNRIPGVKDCLGNKELPFELYHLELIESDIEDRQQHRVALNYITPPFTLLEIIGDRLLLVSPEQTGQPDTFDTFMVAMQPQLAITSYKPLGQPQEVHHVAQVI